MNLRPLLIAAFVIFIAPLALAQRAPQEILDNLYTPELLRQTHEIIGLTEEQKAALLAEHQKTQEEVEKLQEKLRAETAALAELTKQEKIDEAAALAQGQKLADLDTQIKKTQFLLLIHIKNTLTPQQQAKLKEIRPKLASIQQKMQQVRELAQKAHAAGKDVSSIQAQREKFEDLMRQGKFDDAEILLADALRTLNADGVREK